MLDSASLDYIHISGNSKHNEIGDIQFSESLLQNLPIAVYTCDADGYIKSYNRAAAKLWGREPVLGRDLWCGAWKIFKVDGNLLPLDSCPMALTLKEKRPFQGEEIIVERPDGNRRFVLANPHPLFDANGALTGAVNTLIDITDQKTDEESKARLAAIVESSHDAIVSKNLNGIIKTWNKEAEHLFGYTAAEAIGRHISLIIPRERLSEEDLIISKIRSGERVDHFETVRLTKDGKEVDISLTISPIKDDKGNIIGASKIARDITEQKALKERMHSHVKSLQIINSLAKSISENLDTQAILQKVTDATTQLIDAEFGAFFYNTVNEKGESLMLYTLSGASKEAFDKFGMPRNTQVFKVTFKGEGILRSDDITKDPRYGKNTPYNGMPEGHLPVVSYLAVPVLSKMGLVIGGLFYGHSQPAKFTKAHEDLVSGIAPQAALALENAKLFETVEALNIKKDEFIGLASHELKTPVTSVLGYLQILQRTLKGDNQNKLFVNKAVQQINKLSSLIADLLDVSKINTGKMPFNFTSFDLVHLLNEVKEMMQQTSNLHSIVLECSTSELMVYADRQRIEQVIINLVSNAIKYSPNANYIIIRCLAAGGNATVSVQDFGAGIPEEEQRFIFERFYRVKNVASHVSGLGIGLYICNEIINRHGGKLSVSSKPGAGSTFTFEIPVSR
ncbi:PAS domain S-box protein [Ilyomonas limi]|uniref:histidine kinase n=1 Tax=Ilyomonas limi TaxID=2575867 RepID=A0A4U3LAA7_9BACT|nr:PAS domain S-box protein [Ilyomonas limi]TKK71589.1 PAS domain S-box protein [Ilyomonas limi]